MPQWGICDQGAEDDDIVQVRLNWTSVTGADNYRIYRQEEGTEGFLLVATVDAGGSSNCRVPGTFPEYCDSSGIGWDYTYYVVATDDISGTEEEGPASLSGNDRATESWSATQSVRNVAVGDSRDFFGTDNDKARYTKISWSRIAKRNFQGYHVYRLCESKQGQLNAAPTIFRSTDMFTCETSWVRITDAPATNALRQVKDDTTGGVKGYYMYAVRPIGPDGTEGPITKVAGVDLNPIADSNPHCWDQDLVHAAHIPFSYGTMSDELIRVNGEAKGTGSSVGAPATPAGIGMSWHDEDAAEPGTEPSGTQNSAGAGIRRAISSATTSRWQAPTTDPGSESPRILSPGGRMATPCRVWGFTIHATLTTPARPNACTSESSRWTRPATSRSRGIQRHPNIH